MHLSVIVLLPALVTVVYAVPINFTFETLPNEVKLQEVVEKDLAPAQVSEIIVNKETGHISEVVVGTPVSEEVVSSGESTTLPPKSDSGERTGRQTEDEDDEEGNADEDDEEEDDGEEEEEEEERKLPAGKVGVKPGSKKKTPTPGKPVPVLVEGVEDDEAEDLGIFEREDVKSEEKSDEEKSEEDQQDEDDDESGEDDERSERPGGLVADPSSNERGDAYDTPASPIQNEVNESERPLAVAVVEREEQVNPAVSVLAEDINTPSESQISQLGEKTDKPRKNKPKKEVEDDDEDDDEEEEEEEEEAARSDKVNQARAANYPSPVLYYYPFPESAVVAHTPEH